MWGSFLLARSLRVGEFVQTIRFRPFAPLTYETPEVAVYSSRGEYRHITRLLALSFYQLVENRFLQEAKTRFATDEGKKYVDLNAVSSIVELCFNGSDVARSGDKLLGSLQQVSPTSVWLPLLRSCLHYSRGEFDEAASAVNVPPPSSPPLRNASIFFRAVNQLRAYILKSNRGAVPVPASRAQAASGFQAAAEMSDRVEDAYFKEIARGSANIFQDITHIYQHDNDKAHEAFMHAAESSYPEIKARSYSDLGYVALLLGSLSDANGYFVRSLEAAPNFPYARTNLGYVLLAEGQYDEARALFANWRRTPTYAARASGTSSSPDSRSPTSTPRGHLPDSRIPVPTTHR
ncbi:tetratricopeptide repeat protein [Methylobacterium fujisawaense]